MALTFNGSSPTAINFNGQVVQKVIFNGSVVWENVTYQQRYFYATGVVYTTTSGGNPTLPSSSGSFKMGGSDSNTSWNAFIPSSNIDSTGDFQSGSATLTFYRNDSNGEKAASNQSFLRGACGMSKSGLSTIRAAEASAQTQVTIPNGPATLTIAMTDALYNEVLGTAITYNNIDGRTIGGKIAYMNVTSLFKAGSYDMYISARYYDYP